MRHEAITRVRVSALALLALGTSIIGAVGAPTGPRLVPNLVYGSAEGSPLRLDAYLPSGREMHAAVIFVHGGGFRSGDREHLAPGEAPVASVAGTFTAAGYAFFSIDYRLTPRFPYPAGARDVGAAVRWVRERAPELGVDPTRLALFGASAGGNLAALVATWGRGSLDRGARVRVAVSWSGPMDLALLEPAHPFVREYLGCRPARCPGRYREASPISHVDPSDPPILLANGTTEIVPAAQARAMADRLTAAGVPHELLRIAGARHAGEYRTDALPSTLRFISRSVGDRS